MQTQATKIQSFDSMALATKIIKRQNALEDKRVLFESQWREINYYVAPGPDYFYGTMTPPGEKRTQRMFDDTPTLALDKFAAAMASSLTPSTKRWHKLETKIPEFVENHNVQVYMADLTDTLFRARYTPKANFANQSNELYRSLGKYGTGAMFIDDDLGNGITYKSIHISELYFAENSAGIIDTVYRKFRYTAYQALDAFGYDALPDMIKVKLNTSPDSQFVFIHAVYRNLDYDSNYKDAKGMKFKSCYVCVDSQTIIREGGYRTMPYAVSRYITDINEIYGHSPAMDTLATIKMINQMRMTFLRSAQFAADPPLLVPEEGIFNLSVMPGGVTIGGLTEDGRSRVVPLQLGANVQITEAMIQQERTVINTAFLNTLFQILVETPQMTATEAMYRQQEKASLLAPMIGRQQSEFLGPMIERELDILAHAGQLPKMPDELIAYNGRYDHYDIVYEGPFSQAQKADEGIGIMNTLQAASGVVPFDPNIMRLFNLDVAMRRLTDINGAPPEMLYSEEVVAERDAVAAQQAQIQQMLQAAPIAANTAKTMAEAQSIAGQSAPYIPGVA